MDPLFWSVVFLVLMLCMIVIELLTPTMGFFILVAGLFSGASIFTGFRHSDSAGYVMIAVNVTLYPLSIYLGFQLLRKSPIINQAENASAVQNAPDALPLDA